MHNPQITNKTKKENLKTTKVDINHSTKILAITSEIQIMVADKIGLQTTIVDLNAKCMD